jgi:hypothetical protein
MTPAGSKILYRNQRPRFPISDRGEGAYLYDLSGKRYIDAVSDVGVVSVGHGIPEIIDAQRTSAFFAGIAPALGAVLDHHGFKDVRRSCEEAIAAWDFAAAAAAIPDDVFDIAAVAGTSDETRGRLSEYECGVDTGGHSPPSLGLGKGEIEEAHATPVETFGSRRPA